MRARSVAAAFVVAGVLGLAARPAAANGAFPNVSQLVADPDDPSHMVLRATFGLLVTRNGGADWDWLCEAGMGYQDIEPPLTVLAGGTILLGLPNGVGRSDPSGCDFASASGLTASVVDVSRVVARPGEAVALSVTETTSQVWRTTDGGQSFEKLGIELRDFVATTLDVAPGDPKRLYVSGVGTDGPLLLRSDDRGETFEATELPKTDTARRPFIALVGPDDDTVFVRLDGLPGYLLASRDAGATFEQVLELRVPIQGFSLSPDRQSVLATNSFDGSYRADLETLEFERISCRGPSCLLWTSQGLFGCGSNLTDGYVLGSSGDHGATFERVVDLSCVRGPLACDEDSSTGSTCESVWPAVQMQLGAETCSPPATPAPLSCGLETPGGDGGAAGDGAEGGAGGEPAPSSSGGSGDLGGAPAEPGGGSNAGYAGSFVSRPPAAEPEASGCGCQLPRPRLGLNGWLWTLLGAIALAIVNRRATGKRARPT